MPHGRCGLFLPLTLPSHPSFLFSPLSPFSLLCLLFCFRPLFPLTIPFSIPVPLLVPLPFAYL